MLHQTSTHEARCLPVITPDAGLVWLGRDILDKQIVDTQGVKLVRVNDIVLTNLNDELRVAGVDGSTTGLLRRLGLGRLSKRRPPLIDWEQVDIGPAVREVRLKVPFAGLRRMHPADIAHIATQMSPGEAADVFEELDDETAAKAIAELPDDRQVPSSRRWTRTRRLTSSTKWTRTRRLTCWATSGKSARTH